jgi:hypothetical protein
MMVLMNDTIQYMLELNPTYTTEIINTAQDSGNVFMIMGKDGKPSGAYIKVDDIDMEKFGNIKDSIE